MGRNAMNMDVWNNNCKKYNYTGFGNYPALIWFVGIEFRGGASGDDNWDGYEEGEVVYPIPSQQIREESRGKDKTLIYTYMSRIMWHWSDKKETHIEYRDKQLLQPGDNSYFTNMYLFARPDAQANITPFMRQLGFKDKDDYFESLRTHRFPMLRSAWNRHRPKCTVCFVGKKLRHDFCSLFDLNPATDYNPIANGRVEYYPEQGLFLTPIFGHGLDMEKVIDPLAKVIDEITKRT